MDEDDAWMLIAVKVWGDKDAEEAMTVVREEYFRRWNEIQELKRKQWRRKRDGKSNGV
jgi:hypothetical protein